MSTITKVRYKAKKLLVRRKRARHYRNVGFQLNSQTYGLGILLGSLSLSLKGVSWSFWSAQDVPGWAEVLDLFFFSDLKGSLSLLLQMIHPCMPRPDLLFSWCPFLMGPKWRHLTSPSGNPRWLVVPRLIDTRCLLFNLDLTPFAIIGRSLTCFCVCIFGFLTLFLLECKWCCCAIHLFSQMEHFCICLPLTWSWLFHAFQVSSPPSS